MLEGVGGGGGDSAVKPRDFGDIFWNKNLNFPLPVCSFV